MLDPTGCMSPYSRPQGRTESSGPGAAGGHPAGKAWDHTSYDHLEPGEFHWESLAPVALLLSVAG